MYSIADEGFNHLRDVNATNTHQTTPLTQTSIYSFVSQSRHCDIHVSVQPSTNFPLENSDNDNGDYGDYDTRHEETSGVQNEQTSSTVEKPSGQNILEWFTGKFGHSIFPLLHNNIL